MTSLHERYVTNRFDALEARFKALLARDDYRLEALRRALGPLAGRRILDLGCGKGRFAREFRSEGAEVVGLDPSSCMLFHASGLDRVRATARRLPLSSRSFDDVIAVEVFEHIARVDEALREVYRVLRPGGQVAIVDKNAGSLNVSRRWLPNLAVKWLDQRRGRWMYLPGSPARERWFWPPAVCNALGRHFDDATVEFLLSPAEGARWIFRALPPTRLMALWTARKTGGARG